MDASFPPSLVFASTTHKIDKTSDLDLDLLDKCKRGDLDSIEKIVKESAYYKNRRVRIQFKLFCHNNSSNACIQILKMFYYLGNGKFQKAKRLHDYTIGFFDTNCQDRSKPRPTVYYFAKGGLAGYNYSNPSLELAIQACAGAPESIYRNNPLILSQKLLLGTSYYHGEGVPQDLEKAKAYLMCLLGSSSRAAYRLGRIAQKAGNDEEAIEYYKYVAPYLKTYKLDLEKDWYRIKSSYELGVLYGKNAKKKVYAIEYFRRAAEAGHPLAQYEYGKILIADKGNTKCYNNGLKWLQKAEEQGLQKAKTVLDQQSVSLPRKRKGSWLSHIKKEVEPCKEEEGIDKKDRKELDDKAKKHLSL